MNIIRLAVISATLGISAALGADGNPFTQLKSPFEPAPETLAAPDADAAFKPLPGMASMEGLMAAIAGKKTLDERRIALHLHFVRVMHIGTAFCQKYPEDPRCWRAVQMMSNIAKEIASDDGTPQGKIEGVEWDVATFVAWRKQIDELSVAAEHAPDAPPEVKLRAESMRPNGLRALSGAVQQALQAKQPADFAALKAEILRLAAKYPTVESLNQQTSVYFTLRSRGEPPKAELIAEAGEFAASPSLHVQQAAKAELDKLTAFDKAFALAFTAVDGSAVDVAKLKGKVVLVDFWATWCGPCKAEIPNIKRVYGAYHDKGFEIIGISLENAAIKADDTPDQIAAKHDQAKKILSDFTAKSEMPWPQYYDGKHWKNDVSSRFGIASIPAMFLLDQEGKIVSTEARGPKLEAEVKRLLKL